MPPNLLALDCRAVQGVVSVEHNSGEGAAAFYQCRSCETYMSHTQLYSRVEPLVPKKKGPQVDPLTIPCPSCQSRVVHNSGEGKDAFF